MHPLVREQLARLKEFYPNAEVKERTDGSVLVTVPDVPIPKAWNKTRVTITINLPPGYPTAKPSGFEADRDIALADGRKPTQGCGEHAIDGQVYAHFCWQPGAQWENDPNELWKRVKFAVRRFAEVTG